MGGLLRDARVTTPDSLDRLKKISESGVETTIVEIECKPRQKSRPALYKMVVGGRSPEATTARLREAGVLSIFDRILKYPDAAFPEETF